MDAQGKISTVAGTGSIGSLDGPAASAQMGYPLGLAVDSQGDVYFADYGNNRIRKLDVAASMLTTLAPAENLDRPRAVAADAAGHVYVAEDVANRVRKLAAGTGSFSTVAGDGTTGFGGDGAAALAAQLNYPSGLALDAAGHLYIADANNSRLRKVDAATGLISTTAGNGGSGADGDGAAATLVQLGQTFGVAVGGPGGHLYIADFGEHRVRKVDAATGFISTVAGTGTPGFDGDNQPADTVRINAPRGLAVDTAGHLYFADSGNNRIRRVDAITHEITTVAGDGTQGYGGDGAAATAAQLDTPLGVAVDTAGNLYIADTSNSRIRMVDALSGHITTVAGDGTAGFGGDGAAATAAQLDYPASVAVDASGQIFIADAYNARVRRVDAGGTIRTLAGDGTAGLGGDGGAALAAQIDGPLGLAVDAAGRVYIADTNNQRIRRVQPDVPGAPTGVTASAGNGSATVSWTAPASNGGSSITRYTTTAVQDGTKTCTPSPATATTCTVGSLANGTAYTFTVKASNAVGDSAASAASAPAVTPVGPVAPPAGGGGGGGTGPAVVNVNTPGGSTTLTDPTLPIVVGPNAGGATIVLPGTGTTPVPLQITVNGQPLSVTALPGTQLQVAQANGQAVLVLVVLQGSASMTATSAGQPMVLAGTVLLSAGSAGTRIDAQPLAAAVAIGSLLPPPGALPELGGKGLLAGERLQVDAQGKVVAIALGSVQGDAQQTGDAMAFTHLPPALTVDGKAFARLGGAVARLAGASLAQGLEVAASGVVLVRDGAQVFQLLPVQPVTIDARLPDGLGFTPLGLLRWVRGGVVVQFAPAVADLAGLASAVTAALPGATLKLGAEGVLQLGFGGQTYVLRPDWTGAGTGTGEPRIGVDARGRIVFQTGTGPGQLLLPSLLNITQAHALFTTALPGSTLAVQPGSGDGALTLTLDGQRWRLVPQWVLPTGDAAAQTAPWTLGTDGLLYLRLGAQVQGLGITD